MSKSLHTISSCSSWRYFDTPDCTVFVNGLWWLILAGAALAEGAGSICAQTIAERQIQTRIAALDRELSLLPTAAEVGRFVANSLSFDATLPWVARLAEQTSQQTWSSALAEMLRLIHDVGDDLTPTPANSVTQTATVLVRVRDAMQDRVRQLPPSVLVAYRHEVDVEAQKLLAEWRNTSSLAPLQRIVRDLGITPTALEASAILGDLAFENERYHEAQAWWRHRTGLETPAELAQRAAKVVLAHIFLERFSQAERAIAELKKDFPDTRGALAGRTGPYAETLTAWLNLRRTQANGDASWPTFAGSVTRNRVLATAPESRAIRDSETWRVRLPRGDGPAVSGSGVFLRPTPHHPVIADGQVMLADGQCVMSFHLATGQARFRFDGKAILGKNSALSSKSNHPLRHEGLHTSAGRTYAVLNEDTLVCLDTASGASKPGELLWHITARTPDDKPASFESAPLVVDEYAWIVLRQDAGLHAPVFLACNGARRGTRQWVVPLDSTGLAKVKNSPHPLLLTWAGTRIIYATHRGSIVALDPWTGQHCWHVNYPSKSPHETHWAHDPMPAVVDDGRVIVAPVDSRQLLCLSSATGTVLWELPAVEVVHLLGVTDEMVIFATRHGLEAVDVRTGGAVRRWRQPSGGRLPSVGRGLLAGPDFWWPTNDAALPVRAVAVDDNVPTNANPTALHLVPAGNLIWGNGCLVVATPNELVVFPRRNSGLPTANKA